MPWHCLEIESSDVAGVSANALMNQFAAAYRARGMPADARVYHTESSAGDHLYYFSPEASSLAGDVLRSFGATECSGEPDLSGFRPVSL